jgi:predicted nuclease with TOPRIM domain
LTDALGSVRERMKNLEAENAQLKERLARANTAPEIR